MNKESKIALIFSLSVISLMIIIYILLYLASSSIIIRYPILIFPFFFYIDIIFISPAMQELRDLLFIICLIFPIITLIIAINFYYSIQHAMPLFFSGLAFLFFEGAWARYPDIFLLLSSTYFLIGIFLTGGSLWLEADLLVKRHPEVFQETEEEEPEPMDIEFTEDDYKDEVKFWIKLLDSKDEKFREEAIISLGEIGDERALPHLEKFLNDESKSTRNLSKKAINAIKRSLQNKI